MDKKKMKKEQKVIKNGKKITSKSKEVNMYSWDKNYVLQEVKNFWIFVAKISTISCFILLITLIYYVKQNKYIPYIVEIKDGKIENTSILKSSTIKASDSQIKYFLSEIISNIFIISIDPKIQDKNLEKVSSFLTNETYTKVQNLLKENQIKSKIEKGYTTDLEIISINEIPETKNHQMRFLVTEFNNTGKVVIKTYYSIIFKTIIKTNKNEKSVFLNPLGLIVTDFNLTKEKEEKISF